MTEFKYIDLCSGTGGFHMAMERIKNIPSRVILAADIDTNCMAATYPLDLTFLQDSQ